ncbi:tetratricopeptide repeat-containing serine protease family protein [Fischerella thermalis]|uniref:tetratricopeptide repeat-containing S1 family peptidase n=1 Tax=Fischerella thermalis TaxID=372787 RepID=UPI00307F94F7
MNFGRYLPAVLMGATVVVVQPQVALGLTATQVSNLAKEFTVLIGGDGVGSGVIFDRQGDTYYVLTNQHVVANDGRYEIQTPDNSRYPVYRSQELPGLDLAIVQFNSNKNYRVANLGNSDQIQEGMTVYVVGWADVLPGITSERTYQFTEGKIRTRLQKSEDGYGLVYNNEAIPGMSGGPVLDEQGRVVGINGRADTEVRKDGTLVASLRLGIPINTFLAARKNSPSTNTPQKPATNVATSRTTPVTSRKITAEGLISSGGAKAKRGDYQGAISDYNQALQLSPNNSDAFYQRGVANHKQKNYQAALEDFNQVIRLSPKNAFAYAFRGHLRLQLGDFKGANADGNQAIRLEPNSGYGYLVRGAGRFFLKEQQGAFADFDHSIKLLPDQPNVYIVRAVARRFTGDKQGALADYQKAAALFKQQGDEDGYQDAVNEIKELQGI